MFFLFCIGVTVAGEKSKRFGDQRKEETKKWQSVTKNQTQIRQAKAFVISMMGEFTKTCQSKQVKIVEFFKKNFVKHYKL